MRKKLQITNIFGGISPTFLFGPEGSFLNSSGIDPDHPMGSSYVKNSGAIVPVQYSKFSVTEVTGYPMFITANPKNANSYVYTSNGKMHSFDSNIAMRATEGAVNFPVSLSNASGNGLAYYNNYIYFIKDTDIDRYGPMNGTPALTANVWTGAILGTKTAMTNTTYPVVLGAKLPNHVAHVHGDDAMYVADVLNGAGILHRVKTKKVTVEGDTDDNTAYNVLDLPSGMLPTCMESYGTDLVIGAIQTTSTSINQGKAALYFWDTFDDSFYNEVPLPDAFVTAIKNINGVLYIWSGNASYGCRVSRYVGGDSIEQVAFIDDARPPYAGAVEGYGDRVLWGTHVELPASSGCVLAYGSKDSRLPKAINNIVRTTDPTQTDSSVTCLKIVQQASGAAVRFVTGWGNGSTYGLDKLGSATPCSWLSSVFLVGKKFKIKKIQIPLASAVSATTEMDVQIVMDNESTTHTLTQVTNANFSGKRNILYKEPDLKAVIGENNFYLRLGWSAGSAQQIVIFPIEIEIDIYDDEN